MKSLILLVAILIMAGCGSDGAKTAITTYQNYSGAHIGTVTPLNTTTNNTTTNNTDSGNTNNTTSTSTSSSTTTNTTTNTNSGNTTTTTDNHSINNSFLNISTARWP